MVSGGGLVTKQQRVLLPVDTWTKALTSGNNNQPVKL
jgi:hypothetical protein